MKNIFIPFCILFLLVSCSIDKTGLDTPRALVPAISLSSDTVRVASDALSAELEIDANTDWYVETPGGGWVDAYTQKGGRADKTISLSFSGNVSETADRIQEFTVVSVQNTDIRKKFCVVQAPLKYITFTPDSFATTSKGGSFYIDIVSNVGWQITAPDVLTLSQQSGQGTASVKVDVPVSTVFVSRDFPITVSTEEEIIFGQSGWSKTLDVHQEASKATFEVSPLSITVDADKTYAEFVVFENVGYEIDECPGVVISVEETAAGHNVKATFGENDSYTNRNFSIKVKALVVIEGIEAEKTVTITQKGKDKVAVYNFATEWPLTPAIVKTKENTQDYTYVREGDILSGEAHLLITTGGATNNWSLSLASLRFYKADTPLIHPYFTIPALEGYEIRDIFISHNTSAAYPVELWNMSGEVLEHVTLASKTGSYKFVTKGTSAASGAQIHLTQNNAQYQITNITVTYTVK